MRLTSHFKQVATVAKLLKQDFKPPDKAAKNYDLKPFHVDGMIEIDIEFQDKAMVTPIYVKMDVLEFYYLKECVDNLVIILQSKHLPQQSQRHRLGNCQMKVDALSKHK